MEYTTAAFNRTAQQYQLPKLQNEQLSACDTFEWTSQKHILGVLQIIETLLSCERIKNNSGIRNLLSRKVQMDKVSVCFIESHKFGMEETSEDHLIQPPEMVP